MRKGIISSNEMITEKEGYEAMLYMLKAYWEATGSSDLTDFLSGGSVNNDKVIDTAYWDNTTVRGGLFNKTLYCCYTFNS